MTNRPLHLFGPMAADVAPFITRLGVPITTEPPTARDAQQLYCHNANSKNRGTVTDDLWHAHTLAPGGNLASWGLVKDPHDVYAVQLHAEAPSGPKGAGSWDLLRILRELGYRPALTLSAILSPHPEPDPAPVAPEEWIRHTTAVPAGMTATPGDRWGWEDGHRAMLTFWQMTPDLRDAWLLDPASGRVMESIPGWAGPLHNMIWHRGRATRPEIMDRFAGETHRMVRQAWLQGIAHWGTPEQLPLAHDLATITTVEHGHPSGTVHPTHLPSMISHALGDRKTHRRLQGARQHLANVVGLGEPRVDSTVGLAILRLMERDPGFGETLLAQIESWRPNDTLQKMVDAYLAVLPQPIETEPTHPSRSTMVAYFQRTPRREISYTPRPDRVCALPHPDGEAPEGISASTNPIEGVARLTELAGTVRGPLWRSAPYGNPVEAIICAWGRNISEAGDSAMGEWLQSFRGPVSFLARVANGVITWPTLTPATVTGIARARGLSRQVRAEPSTGDLIKRIPDELIPAEWRTIAAAQQREHPGPVR